jgi:hypothetical protein
VELVSPPPLPPPVRSSPLANISIARWNFAKSMPPPFAGKCFSMIESWSLESRSATPIVIRSL